MRKVAAFVLAGGRVAEAGVLTQRRAKAALAIGGHYRIIDFVMSNLARAGVNRVGVLSQYRPSSLMDHVGFGEPWGLVGRNREVKMLSPFQAEKVVDWYRGTAEAVSQNMGFLQDEEWVLVVSGDHVYQMDYRALFQEHERTGADLTMVFKHFPRERCTLFGNIRIDDDRRIVEYVEKPTTPLSDLGSLTIYLFKREALERTLRKWRAQPDGQYFLYQNIIPEIIGEGRAHATILNDYWSYTRTVDDYYETSMDLILPGSGFDLARWHVNTNAEQSGIGAVPPALVGRDAEVSNSWLSPGCRICGRVVRSVISPGVVVEKGAEVIDSVLLHGTQVAAGSLMRRVIADKHCRVGSGSRVGHEEPVGPNRNTPDFHRSGVTVLGREVRIGEGSRIGANCQVTPESELAPSSQVPDRETL